LDQRLFNKHYEKVNELVFFGGLLLILKALLI